MKFKYIILFFVMTAQAQNCVQVTFQVQNNSSDNFAFIYNDPDDGRWDLQPSTVNSGQSAQVTGINSHGAAGFEGTLTLQRITQANPVICNIHVDFPYWDSFMKQGTLHEPTVSCPAEVFTVARTDSGGSCYGQENGQPGVISVNISNVQRK